MQVKSAIFVGKVVLACICTYEIAAKDLTLSLHFTITGHHAEAKLVSWWGMCRITNAPLQEISTDKQVTDEGVKTLLATSLKSKKKNKKKKAAKVESGAKEVEAEQ